MNKTGCEIDIIETSNLPRPTMKLILDNFVSSCKGPDNEMSHPKVAANYGKKQLPKSHFILVSQRQVRRTTRSGRSFGQRDPDTELCGFLFLHIYTDGRLKYGYIDVVCSSRGQGRKLVKAAENFSKTLGCKYMRLSALNYIKPVSAKFPKGFNLHEWYESMGYEHIDNPCNLIKERSVKKNSAGKTPNHKNFMGEREGYRMTKCIDDQMIQNQLQAKRKRNNNINQQLKRARKTPLPPNNVIRKTDNRFKRKVINNYNNDNIWFNSQNSLNSNQ